MKKILRLTIIISALLGMTACTQENVQPDDETTPYNIEYTIGLTSATVTIKDEAHWNHLLDWLIQQSTMGTEVTFRTTFLKENPATSKAADTCRTTSRDEIRDWCSKMERAGKTVTITYDRVTGTYTGTAYARRPRIPKLDPSLMVGHWDLQEKTVTMEYADGTIPNTNTFSPNDPQTDIRTWVFHDDGTVQATLNRNAGQDTPARWGTYVLDWEVKPIEGTMIANGTQVQYRLYQLTITGTVEQNEYAMTMTVRTCDDRHLLVEQNMSPKETYPGGLSGNKNVRTVWHFVRGKSNVATESPKDDNNIKTFIL